MLELKLVTAVVFALSGVASGVAGVRALRIADEEVRRGLVALLGLTTLWAVLEAARLAVGTSEVVAHAGYVGGLVVGLAAVGAWAYFCSAYAGFDYHRRRSTVVAGGVVYVAVAVLKLTNPLHGWYYTVQLKRQPFTHFAVDPGLAHWAVVAGVYVVVAAGFLGLWSAFREAHADTTALWALSAVAALPVLPEAGAALYGGILPGLNYEPLGVAVFGVGVLFVADDGFFAVGAVARQQVTEEMESAVVVVDRDHRLLDHNPAAAELFPGVDVGTPLEDADPVLRDCLESGADHAETVEGDGPDLDSAAVVTLSVDGRPRHYLCRAVSVDVGARCLGWAVVLSDVTELEAKRRELRRQNEQLDDFAAGITHELRNPLSVVRGYVEQLDAATEGETVDRERLDRAVGEITEATDRMATAVDELNTLARRGRAVEEVDRHRVSEAMTTVRDQTGVPVETIVATDGVVAADGPRLRQILGNLLTYAGEEDVGRVRTAVGEGDLTVELVGDVDPEETTRLLRYGYASGGGDTRLSLANVRALARAHGWRVGVEDVAAGVAVRFEPVESWPDGDADGREAPTTGDRTHGRVADGGTDGRDRTEQVGE